MHSSEKLYHLLAALSGRRPQELELAIVFERFIKDGDAPRVLDNHTLENIDNAVLHDYLEEKKFNREVSLAFIIMTFFLLIVPILLLCFAIWWTLK